jgi:hypothetical protein
MVPPYFPGFDKQINDIVDIGGVHPDFKANRGQQLVTQPAPRSSPPAPAAALIGAGPTTYRSSP